MKVSTKNKLPPIGPWRTSIGAVLAAVTLICFSCGCDGKHGTIDPHHNNSSQEKQHDRHARDHGPHATEKEDHHHKNESGNAGDHDSHESGHAKPLILSEKQIERLGLQLTAARQLSQGADLYLLPTEAVVEVLDEFELYSLDAQGTVMRHAARLVRTQGARSLVSMRVPAGRRIVTRNAALVRLAQLNASDPGEGHGH